MWRTLHQSASNTSQPLQPLQPLQPPELRPRFPESPPISSWCPYHPSTSSMVEATLETAWPAKSSWSSLWVHLVSRRRWLLAQRCTTTWRVSSRKSMARMRLGMILAQAQTAQTAQTAKHWPDVFGKSRKVAESRTEACNVGDEGGFAPNVQDNNEAGERQNLHPWVLFSPVSTLMSPTASCARPWMFLWKQSPSRATATRSRSEDDPNTSQDCMVRIRAVRFVNDEHLHGVCCGAAKLWCHCRKRRWRLAQMLQLPSSTLRRRSITTWTSRIQAAQQMLEALIVRCETCWREAMYRPYWANILQKLWSSGPRYAMMPRRWRRLLHSWQIITRHGWTSTPSFPSRIWQGWWWAERKKMKLSFQHISTNKSRHEVLGNLRN